MNKKVYLLVFIAAVIGISVFFLTRCWRQATFCPQPSDTVGTVVIWNKSDRDIDLSLKQNRHDLQKVVVNKTMRACIKIFAKGKGSHEPDPIGNVYVTYDEKKYRFDNTEVLNAFPNKKEKEDDTSAITTRHFVLLKISAGVGEWENIKKRVEVDDYKLDEKSQYLILSNYHKLGDFWGQEAQISLVKIRN